MAAEALDRDRRAWVQAYFDRTAAAQWARLTSPAPLGRVRASVRSGRDRMRHRLLAWLADDLTGVRVLDAGCGTGQMAVDLASRGAAVTAVDLSPNLVSLAVRRAADSAPSRSIDFRVADMLDPALGRFDHVVAMDSLIHYEPGDCVAALAALASRTERSILFTFAPRTPLLALLHALGRCFPRGQRSPSIVPLAERALWRRLDAEQRLRHWRPVWTAPVATAFYRSQAVALVRERR